MSVERRLELLRLLPRAPAKRDVAALHAALEARGYSTTRRTVERDLVALEARFPIVRDGRRPEGWSWTKDAVAEQLPRMDPHTALTLTMVERYLTRVLPRPTVRHLAEPFAQARKVLDGLGRPGVRKWTHNVRVLSRMPPLETPTVRTAVLEAVYQALLEERRLDVRYLRPEPGVPLEAVVNPLGLVYRDQIAYLVATYADRDEAEPEARHLLLHRFERAAVVDAPVKVPAGFDLDARIASGAFGLKLREEPVDLVLRFRRPAHRVPIETPLSRTQTIRARSDGFVEVAARLPFTGVLRGWLLSYGPLVEVLAPDDVRREVAARLRQAAEQYEATASDATRRGSSRRGGTLVS